MALRAGRKKLVVTATLVVCSFALTGPAAQAFFPPWWPTGSTSKKGSPEDPIYIPPLPPDPTPPDPAPPDPTPPDCSCPSPNCVPEPSTLAGGLAGLLAAVWAARRGRRA